MKDPTPIGVTSRSFSRHPVLRAELLERYADVRFNDGDGGILAGDALVAFARGRRKLITALERIDDAFLASVPELEVIAKYGVGTDMLDKGALIRHGVRLGWTGGVNRRSVAELALCFMISLLRKVPAINGELRLGRWHNEKGRQLSGRTVGIIGCGHIGKDLVGLLRPFGCDVLAHDIRDYADFYRSEGVRPVGLDALLRESDIVTLHVPLDASTRQMLNVQRLAQMRPGAILINTARGGLVEEQALKVALREGKLAGAGFDVFEPEPPEDVELLRLPNFLSTAHIGGSSEEAILNMGRAAIAGLDNHQLPTEDYPPAG